MNFQTEIGANPDTLYFSDLRKLIGLIGVFLPPALVLGNFLAYGILSGGRIWVPSPWVLRTMSSYYYSHAHGIFVGSMCAIGVFLWAYRGYRTYFTFLGIRINDNRTGNVACICAIGLSLFHTTPDSVAHACGTALTFQIIHYIFAGILFGTLAVFCLYLFTQSSGGKTPQKEFRNKIYVTCGRVILACIVIIGILNLFSWMQSQHIISFGGFADVLFSHSAGFALEFLAVEAFGFSWLVKGGVFFADASPAKLTASIT